MSKHSQKDATEAPRPPEWQQALDSLERSLREASVAVALLRQSLQANGQDDDDAAAVAPTAPLPPTALAPVEPAEPEPPEPESPAPEASAAKEPAQRLTAFDRLWDRVEQEKLENLEKQAGTQPEAAPERRGLDALPQHYLMTVEDREGKVDLVPLHRSLAALPGMEEVSLVSYSNGVPVVSLRLEGELDLDQLGAAVATGMDRECEVIPQDKSKIYLRLRASER